MVFGIDPDNVRSVLNVMCRAFDGLNVCCLNAESIRAKYSVFYQMFSTSRVDVIMVSESWLSAHHMNALVALPGFKLHRNDRKDRVGGGVCLYVRELISASTVYSSTTANIEFICVEIKNAVEKCLFVTLYSPPNMFREENLFELKETLLRLSPKYSGILIGGDFNVNILLNNNITRLLNYFCDVMGLSVINSIWPTCFKSDSNPSLLDMFLTSSKRRILGNDQIRPTSDFIHDFIFCSYQFDVNRTNTIHTVSYRSYRGLDHESIQTSFLSSELNEIYSSSDVNSKVTIFNNVVTRLYDEYVPIVTKEFKIKKCPWFNDNIKAMIRERERFFRRFKANRTEYNRRQYTVARNKVISLIRNSKREYISAKLDPSLGSKELWNNLKKLGVKEDKNENKCPFSAQSMSNVLIPPSSGSRIPHDLFTVSGDDNTLSFVCISPYELLCSIKSVKSNCIGPDDISPKFLKFILPIIINHLLHVINFCIYSAQFPDAWKKANIIPVPKKANPSNPSDFRPISILCFLCKVFEKIIHDQIQDYLTENNLLSQWQSGFRSKHSCESAVVKVTSDFRFALDSGKFGVMVLLDFSKAFDCIDHSILLSKLKVKFNFASTSLRLLHNYLHNRTQRVKTDVGTCNPTLINTGIPQGSILGPLLFSLFINDLPKVIKNSQIHLYADDVVLYIFRSVGLMEDCIVRLNEDLSYVLTWSNNNAMKLNPAKSVSMLCSRDELSPEEFPPVILDNERIVYVKDVKYLGYKINSNLSCCGAISDTIRKIYFCLRSLRSSSELLSSDMKSYLIKSLILPYFIFNCSVYPILDCLCKRKLYVAFNDCIRFIYGIQRHNSVSQLQHLLVGMSLENYLKYRLILRFHNVIHNRCPAYLSESLQFTNSQRGLKLIVPRFSHIIAERSFYVSAVRLWNSLPNELQSITSPITLKRKLYLHFSDL